MNQSRPRKPRFKRVTESSSLQITPRDIEILTAVGRHRFIQSHHLQMLFPGSKQHLIRRLGRLFHAGYLERPAAQLIVRNSIGSSMVYCLTQQGQQVLQENLPTSIPTVPRMKAATAALSMTHSLRVTDVLVAVRASASESQMIFRWPEEWPSMKNLDGRISKRFQWHVTLHEKGSAYRTLVIPDGAFSLQSEGEEPRYFMLEVDRGTMPATRRRLNLTSFRRKVLAYEQSRRQGMLWKRFQIPAFRALIVAESKKRLSSLQQATASTFKNGESKMFLFAVESELLGHKDILNQAWETCSGQRSSSLMD